MTDKKVSGRYLRIRGRIKEIAVTIPSGLPPVLRRFWKFARDMSRHFSRHLLKERDEEFLKAVRKDFEKGI